VSDRDAEAGEAAYEAAAPRPGLRDECALVVLTAANLVTWHPLHPVSLLERNGFELVAARLVRLSTAQIARIWAEQIPGFHPDRWAAAVCLLGAGPSLACLAHRRGSHDEPASEAFATLKGPSEPAALRPHHLRRQLGAVNKLNNLLHSADTTARTVRETAIFFGPAGARRAWRAAVAPRRAGSGAVLAKALHAASAPIVVRPTGASFAHAAVAARLRAFDRFERLLAPAEGRRLRRRLRDEAAYVEQRSPRLGARLLADPEAPFATPADPLDATGGREPAAERWLLLFDVLGDALANIPRDVPQTLRRAMRELKVSRWDQILIESQLAARHA
jgi:nucleoside diphosphate kinase